MVRRPSAAGTVRATPTEEAPDSRPPPAGEVAVGAAATALRLGAGVGRIVLLPGRVLVLPFVRPAVRGRAEELAAAGREVEARGRRRLEEAMSDEAVEALGRRLLASPAFERLVREAADSALARELMDEAIRSAAMQKAVDEMLTGPVRGAIGHETKTLWNEVAGRLADGAARAEDSLEQAVHAAFRRRPRVAVAGEPVYAGLASRVLSGVIDLMLANVLVLGLGALIGVLGVLLGLSPPGVVVAVLAGAGWTFFLLGYAALFWSTAGQTPGMRVARLRVEGPDGSPPGVGRSLLRALAALVALAPLGLGLVPVLFDRRRRALQDFVARTVVVRTEAQAVGP